MKVTPVAMVLGALMTAPEPQPVGTVLFVCEHGSAKSVVAAAHFNRLAEERGLPFRAISRGTAPDEEMAPPVVTGLLGEDLKPKDPAPKKLAQADLDAARRVITFCDLPPIWRRSHPSSAGRCPLSASTTSNRGMRCSSTSSSFYASSRPSKRVTAGCDEGPSGAEHSGASTRPLGRRAILF
jgi:hypothetical protein